MTVGGVCSSVGVRSNCTFMELKCDSIAGQWSRVVRSNCTFMELKLTMDEARGRAKGF